GTVFALREAVGTHKEAHMPSNTAGLRRLLLSGAFGIISAAAIIIASPPAHATITFQLGNHPQPDEENILFQSSETGGTITGATNQTNTPVHFSSLTGETLFQGAKGQADIENAADPGKADLTSMAVTLDPGFFFTDFILNPLNGSGTATVSALD